VNCAQNVPYTYEGSYLVEGAYDRDS
jgi:hypothetical protein